MGRPAVDAVIVALSGRALAASAGRAGYRVAAIDFFEDMDTARLAAVTARAPGTLHSGFRAAALLEVLTRIAPAGVPVVCGSGFDRRSRLLGRVSKIRPLLGNGASTVRAVKSPARFFDLLDRLGVPTPATVLSRPADPRGWLVKRSGGAGGAHIRPADAPPPRGEIYYQRKVEGTAISALFLADGRNAAILGFSEQWAAPDERGGAYRFGGAAFPAPLPTRLRSAIAAAIGGIVSETGLVGANSADFIVADGGFVLLEINPRPGASLDAFDLSHDASLFDLHCNACRGALPGAPPAARRGAASMIVYADRRLSAPDPAFWPDWVADIPRPGQPLRAGAPICTVTAVAAESGAARRLVVRRAKDLLNRLTEYMYGNTTAVAPSARRPVASETGTAGA